VNTTFPAPQRVPYGPWVLTHNGAAVPLCSDIEDSSISVLDIAAHLAKINRWNGATLRPNSVAEHSLLVVEIAQRELAMHQPELLLCALLHDAHEAYCGDVVTPMKEALGAPARNIEAPLYLKVMRRFHLERASRLYASIVAECDRIAAVTELRDLIPPSPAAQARARQIGATPVPWINLRERDGICWADWQQAYLDAFAQHYGELHDIAHDRVLLGDPLECA